MDVKYINPFILATKMVFKAMLNIDMTMEKPLLKLDKTTSGDVTGVMGVAGDNDKRGMMCISFSRQGALYAYKTLMGDERSEISPEVVDAIGELTNIISGQSRKELENAGVNLTASIPTVVVGKNVELHFMCKLPIISLPFQFATDYGEDILYVNFSFE
ncbi:MAG TPA: chemotaxis protein CheX [Syntrophorhabdaceae bacterium]|nr:chemotaxis protein CheX [Syntrophorhabdaceae bacterium]